MTRTHEAVIIKNHSGDMEEVRREACAEVKRKLKINSYLKVCLQLHIPPIGHVVVVKLPNKNPRTVYKPE